MPGPHVYYELGDQFTIPVRVMHVENHPSVRNAIQVHLRLECQSGEPITLVCLQEQISPASQVAPMGEDELAQLDAQDAAQQQAEMRAAKDAGRQALMLPTWRDRSGSLSRTVPLPMPGSGTLTS